MTTRRPPELDDPAWLRRRYMSDGDMAIALELGVARLTVRRARERLGIESASPGRRRGFTPTTVEPRERSSADLIALRMVHERVAPTEQLLASRIRALNDARLACDDAAYDDTLIGIASAAGLIHEHRQQLRTAA